MGSFVQQPTGVFPSVCSLDCPDQCGLLVHKKDGKIVKIQGDPSHPVTKGHICNKVRNMMERIYDPKRLKYPLKRIGAKGEGKFARISWDEALETIAAKWKELIETYGPESILPYSFYGNMGRLSAEGMDRRFFHRLGASLLDRTICSSAGSQGLQYTMGGGFGIDPEETIHAKLIIFWGINAVSTNMHQVILAQKARKNGAKIVVIDVHKNQTGQLADWFIPILPGTDAALALGMMHILFAENLIDDEFLRKYTVGYEELREHVVQYDPVTVSNITGVPVEDLYTLARWYGQTTPSFIRIGNGLQHHDNGGMCIRTIACLPALTGQWLVKGGGAIKSNSGYLALNQISLQRPDLLKNKHTRIINMNRLGEALLELDPPIRSLFVYGTNPAVVAPNSNKVRQGLAREDLFVIVHDLFVTETAKYADIVLPATSSFENTDLYTSYWHHYVQIQQPVIERYGESKSNVEVFQLLAKRMGFEDPCLYETEEEMISQALDNPTNPFLEGIRYETLVEKQYIKAKVKRLLPGTLPTPSGKIELYSKKMEQDGYPPLPTYTPIVDDGDFPFFFVPGPNHNFLNTTFSNNEKHISLEKEPRLYMNVKDALAKGIQDGDRVRVWNDRGECVLKASVGEHVLPGVVVTQGLWADSPDTKHLVNSLTPDRIADMGGGATFFSGRVDVEKC
ncbi:MULTISPECIES: molybdopterin-containing oxidoreductase family protein [Geobacillus]|jgi:anaerobic selenocysteine-containing dehydrogenase|uniref:Molybdopterin oxidoreductase family protein n=1 Tax=Geobacillus thermodenitrificans TaxID=33940 RepID=A0ABY9QG55_GEOTD|nr:MULTISPECIES: molybdopterin oxidoreductase family protein [Geobacillus]ARA96717.1 oxidoreductase [Geobacillus thermodenitrificans]ATO35986.1 oxidoreductase [Geobacillus thermodenitrificans]NNU88617.1 molybdopterin oxidoreductase family protein [Geobacillus sp. MR]PJW20726.1 molybdopterin oxidoreductase family protein [Geobacillus thermodenitrificans]PTR47952.1 molybdopterin oxidoreductase family protein [Geobacillus thermodenitrificans]